MTTLSGDTLKALLREADEGGFAIPMFNYTDLWDQKAALEAAEELRAPIMFASIPKTVQAVGLHALGALGKVRMEECMVPVIHHLDHSNSVELCKQAIDYGYPSVMIDASMKSLKENISMVKETVDYAHLHHAHVEGEIGRIKGRDYEANYEGEDFLVQVEDAVELVERTGVDSLAVGIGTAHGFYQGQPKLNFRRLAEVNEAVKVPLVLHGGTGIPMEDVRKAIKNGINKVNVGTQIRFTYMRQVCQTVRERGAQTHTVDIMEAVVPAVKEEVKAWIRVCMAEGRV